MMQIKKTAINNHKIKIINFFLKQYKKNKVQLSTRNNQLYWQKNCGVGQCIEIQKKS